MSQQQEGKWLSFKQHIQVLKRYQKSENALQGNICGDMNMVQLAIT